METIDKDEYDNPVIDRYKRLGANGNSEGIYIRFEPGFGLNVIVGFRKRIPDPEKQWANIDTGPFVYKDFEEEGMTMGIDGWIKIGELYEEWRKREMAFRRERAGERIDDRST